MNEPTNFNIYDLETEINTSDLAAGGRGEGGRSKFNVMME